MTVSKEGDYLRIGLVRMPGRKFLKGNLAGSATFGPGASTMAMRLAIEPKSARKCTELFSASTAKSAGSTRKWRNIA